MDSIDNTITSICSQLTKILKHDKALDIETAIKVFGKIFSLEIVITPWNLKNRKKFGFSKQGNNKSRVFIFFEESTTENHRDLIVFHEVAHWILRHFERNITIQQAEHEAELFALEMYTNFIKLKAVSIPENDQFLRFLME